MDGGAARPTHALRMDGGAASPSHAIFPEIYDDLRQVAERMFRSQRAGHTLQPTAVVNEAFIKLAGHLDGRYDDRSRFFAVAADAIRQILVDHARKRKTGRRGGGWHRVALDGLHDRDPTRELDILVFNDALNRLAELDESRARVVELRVFGGLTVPEIANFLDMSPRTVDRYWRFGRVWLEKALAGEEAHP